MQIASEKCSGPDGFKCAAKKKLFTYTSDPYTSSLPGEKFGSSVHSRARARAKRKKSEGADKFYGYAEVNPTKFAVFPTTFPPIPLYFCIRLRLISIF